MNPARIPRLARRSLAVALALALSPHAIAAPVPNGFRITGFVTSGGSPFNGTIDLEVQLFDAATGNGASSPAVVIEDVPVSAGNLSTFVDFGVQNPFGNADTYLGGGIRLGSSVGAFSPFTGRSRFSPSGFALHAQRVAPGVVGVSEIIATQVQRRVTGVCASGSAIGSINADGTVSCEGTGGGGGGSGDIGSVIAGSGLAGGGTVGDVTLSIAGLGVVESMLGAGAVTTTKLGNNAVTAAAIAAGAVDVSELAANAVTSAAIAPNTIVAADADTTSAGGLQRRVTGVCAGGQSIGAIAADGTVTCVDPATAGGSWGLTGNSGTNGNSSFIGTTDNVDFSVRVNNRRAMRFLSVDDPDGNAYGGAVASVAILGGAQANSAGRAGSTVSGGGNAQLGNAADGEYATVPGGIGNFAGGDYSFAAGRRAFVRNFFNVGGGDTDGDEGTFVWADSQNASFVSTGPNQFLVRAQGGVGINESNPNGAALYVRDGDSTLTQTAEANMVVEGDTQGFLEIMGSSRATIGFRNTTSTPSVEPPGYIAYGNIFGPREMVFATDHAVRMSLDADGDLGLGTVGPANRLHVQKSVAANAGSTNGHVAFIQNLTNASAQQVLALRVGAATAQATADFITFYNGNGVAIGAVQGNGSGGIVLQSPGADYGEYLPKRDANEVIEPGDLIGVSGGRVSRDITRVSRVMVASTGSVVAGNDPGDDARDDWVLTAFVGQAMAKVRGPVRVGDLIVATEARDGIGIAVARDALTIDQAARVAGEAWEASDAPGVKSIRVAVGLDEGADASLAEVQSLRQRVAALESENALLRSDLEDRLARLEARDRANDPTPVHVAR